eukprot:11123-Pelagococcus_subviridis.AAC.1
MAATKDVCTTLLNALSRPYHPPWSSNCLKSSIGGCDPYASRAGRFKSSTKKIARFPGGGPYSPLRRLSSRRSTCSCVAFADVRALNPITLASCVSLSRPRRYRETYAVFPVPVGPHRSSGAFER